MMVYRSLDQPLVEEQRILRLEFRGKALSRRRMIYSNQLSISRCYKKRTTYHRAAPARQSGPADPTTASNLGTLLFAPADAEEKEEEESLVFSENFELVRMNC
jgi:hypothetical protein